MANFDLVQEAMQVLLDTIEAIRQHPLVSTPPEVVHALQIVHNNGYPNNPVDFLGALQQVQQNLLACNEALDAWENAANKTSNNGG